MVRIYWLFFVLIVVAAVTMSCSPSGYATTAKAQTGNECVVVLHGLARSSWSMDDMAENLAAAGYAVVNIDYPSQSDVVENLAMRAIPQGMEKCRRRGSETINFVSHTFIMDDEEVVAQTLHFLRHETFDHP